MSESVVGQVWAHKRDEHRIYLLLYKVKDVSESLELYQALNLHTGEVRGFIVGELNNGGHKKFERIA